MPTTTTNYGWYLPLVNDPTDEDLWGGYLNDNFVSQDTIIKGIADAASTIPPGVVFPYGASSSAPAGYLACDGAAVSRATYAALFAIIGTTWGTGDGSTTFNLPDLRRRTLVGSGGTGTSTLQNTVASVGGVEDSTLTAANLPPHKHPLYGTLTGTEIIGGASFYALNTGGGFSSSENYIGNNTGGTSTAFTNIQPSAVIAWIIKT